MLKEFLLGGLLKHKSRQLLSAAYDPEGIQKRTFSRVWKKISTSRLVSDLKLQDVRTHEDLFKSGVETDAKSMGSVFREVFELGSAGSGIIGQGEILAFMRTSGTTSEPKHIPVTRDFMKSYHASRLKIFSAIRATNPDWPLLISAHPLNLTMRPHLMDAPGGIPVGYGAAVLAMRSKAYGKYEMLPTFKIQMMEDWNQKIISVLDEARGKKVGSLAAMPRLLLALHDQAREHSKVETLREMWPELKYIIFGGVGMNAVMRSKIEAAVGGTAPVHFREIYAATEGIFGCTFDESWPGMVFDPYEIFFSFKEEGGSQFLLLEQLEEKKKYAVYITTPGGLVQYAMGDYVEILSRKPLLFKVAGRTNDEVSLLGERMTGAQIESLLDWLLKTAGVPTEDFAIYGDHGVPKHFHVVVSQAAQLPPRFKSWEELFDEGFKAVNFVYKIFREQEKTLSAPEVHRVDPGVFTAYRARNLTRGQFKGKRLFMDQAAYEAEILGSK